VATITVRPPARSGDDGRTGLVARVRAHTRSEHRHAEVLLDLPARLTRPDDLSHLLRAWLLVWREVCAQCGPADPGERGVLGQAGQDALGAVTADLTDLLYLTQQNPSPQQLAVLVGPDRNRDEHLSLESLLDSAAGVWAVGYVLRGSRLGGRVLAPRIAERLALPAGVALRYHQGPDEVGSWPAFRRRMDTWGRSASPQDVVQVLERARQAFAAVGTRLSTALGTSSTAAWHSDLVGGSGGAA
jgi:heme oxygenase